MSAAQIRQLSQLDRFGVLWWLPGGGESNGLTDVGWAPIADVDAALLPAVMTELHRAGVAAYAAPVSRRPSTRRHKDRAGNRRRLWVGTSQYSRAEDTLRIKLPLLPGQGRA